MRLKTVLWLVLPMFLAACQSAGIGSQPDENSTDYLVPVGTALVLQQPLQVPAWQDQVYFQEGRIKHWGGVNAYLPYCTLKLSAKKDTERRIQRDTFMVNKSYTELFFKEVRAPEPPSGIQLTAAQWQPGMQADFETRNGTEYKTVAAIMELSSSNQPDVTQMLCADWGLPQERPHITVSKIRRALGDVISLRLPPTDNRGMAPGR